MKMLVIAPHPDDEMLGVGGTIIRNIAEGNEVYICIVTKGGPPLFPSDVVEKTRSEARTCHEAIGVKETIFLNYPSVKLEKENRYEINGKILEIIQRIRPDEAFIPHRGDMQLDHQIVVDASMVALRPKYTHKVKRIYAYETLSETGWNIPTVQNDFIPNVYVDISAYLSQKLQAVKIYQSQLSEFPNPRSIEAVEALAKYRGCSVNVKAAEAFMLIRQII